MRRVFAVIAVVALVGVASSWAGAPVPVITTNVAAKNAITIKGKLSSGAQVTETSLAVTSGVAVLPGIDWMTLDIVTGPTTQVVPPTVTNITSLGGGYLVIGTNWTLTISGPTTNIVGTTTQVVAVATNIVVGTITSFNVVTNLGTLAWTNVPTAATYSNSIGAWTTINTALSTNTIDVIGQVTTNGVTTNVVWGLVDTAGVALPKSKYVDVFTGTAGSASNASIQVSSTWKIKTKASTGVTTTNITGKISGVWDDLVSTVTGTIK